MVSIEDDMSIEDQASMWADLLRESGSVPASRRDQLLAWIEKSPEHWRHLADELALREALMLARPKGLEESGRDARIAALVESVRASAKGRLFETPDTSPRLVQRRAPRLMAYAAAAAVAVVAIVLTLSWRPAAAPWVEHTAVPDAEVVQLKDGSLLDMRSGSRMKVRVTDGAREVELLAGTVGFDVRKDLTRPFRVMWAGGSLVVTGTRFAVKLEDSGDANVDVTEGHVQVIGRGSAATPVVISAGEKTRVSALGLVEPLRDSVAGGRLADIAEAYNKRNAPPKFVVQGTACDRAFETRLYIDDPSAFLLALENEPEIKLRRVPDAAPPAIPEMVVIRERSDTKSRDTSTQSDCTPRGSGDAGVERR